MAKQIRPLCTFCHNELETIEHILWDCEIIKIFLDNFQLSMQRNGITFEFDKKNFIFGLHTKLNENRVHNLILLITKFYIYKSRCSNGNLSVESLLHILKQYYHVERHMASLYSNPNSLDEKWSQFLRVINL